MSRTPRLALPFLSVGQAQKEFTCNESLQTLDVLVAGVVEEPPRSAPPASPQLGAAYIVGADASGDWAGKSHCVAAWTSGGWRFISPADGLRLIERSSGCLATYRNGSWDIGTVRALAVEVGGKRVVGARCAAVASPSGGAVVDVEARSSIDAILGALRAHGLIES